MRAFRLTCRFCLVVLLPLLGASSPVELVPVLQSDSFPDATAPQAIFHTCAEDKESLPAYFADRGLRFEPELVRAVGNRAACHVYYEPTVPGFRAFPDNLPVSGLHIAVDGMSFVVGRRPSGDSLDVAKAVLPRIGRSLDVTVTVSGGFDPSLLPPALETHFPESIHRFSIRPSGSRQSHPWVQDHMEAGTVAGELRILTPRRLFEGRATDGEAHRPVLDAMEKEAAARSQLSWEGGDLQIVGHPNRPGETILVHGRSAANYWGSDLLDREISWILRTEFGTDGVIDLSRIGPHVDYLVAFLPDGNTALVAEPVRGSPTLLAAAADMLLDEYGKDSPGILKAMRSSAYWEPLDLSTVAQLRDAIAALRQQLAKRPLEFDPRVAVELEKYSARHCSDDPENCFEGSGKNRMLQLAPDLLRRATDVVAAIEQRKLMAEKLLSLMLTQLPDQPDRNGPGLDATARELRRLGFRVVRVPFLAGIDESSPWEGVSYLNLLAVDDTLFLPRLGLGEYERSVYATLGRRLGGNYKIVPVDARASLFLNGGVHCAFGIVRADVE